MLKVSYDTKPLPPNIKRIRMNVIDSFINADMINIDKRITDILKNRTKYSKNTLQRFYKYKEKLEKEIENKRIFQIKLKAILSWRRPESREFIRKLNEDNYSSEVFSTMGKLL